MQEEFCGSCQNEKVIVSSWLGVPVNRASWSQCLAQLKPEEEGGEAQPNQVLSQEREQLSDAELK